MSEETQTLAQRLFSAHVLQSRLEAELDDTLEAAGIPFEGVGWDDYDSSVELYDVPPDYRLSTEAKALVQRLGFSIIFLNHTDKWETHYSMRGEDALKKDGWRVSYPHKRNDGDPNIWVEERPRSWPGEWKVKVCPVQEER